MAFLSHIRRSFSTQITLWVVGFAAVIMVVILLLIAHFSHVVVSDDGEGRKLLMTALLTAVVSIAILSLFCWWTVRHYVRPLDLLAVSAQRITDGKIDESVPDTVNATSRTDTQYNSVNSYMMLHVRYRLNIFGGKIDTEGHYDKKWGNRDNNRNRNNRRRW